ncbi:winged helix DNA-binding domain-containing protein [Kitasatospora sp. NPDC002040]|uniref:winged helix DNA-binding domain-containing protein n=1 Tax=Kitasatospora sp. NPDC002040 TaxID=3154661 RepID=UPI0033175999
MPVRPRIDDQQRRARLATRQLLAPAHRAGSPEQLAESLLALHASDPASVFLSAAARLADPEPAALERALYEDRALLRLHGMRRTLFVVPTGLAPVVYASSTRKVAERERRGLLAFAAEGGFDAAWLAGVERRTLLALTQTGPATAAQLGKLVPELRETITVSRGKAYEAGQTIGLRLLRVLAMENEIVRGRPIGGWTSGQYWWAVQDALPELPVAEAQAELTRRWLTAFGPATFDDVKWWTGWGVREVRAALAACGAVPVDLDCGEGHALPDDLDPVPEPAPWAALLPSLDPTPMGWQQRDWYLPVAHRAELVDRSGNIGPTVWWNGRVVGGWAQHPDGRVRWEALEPLPREARTAIDAEADRLAHWLGPARVTPRFRTSLERRLAG